MKILHVNDRLSTRGGADWHLLGVLDALRESDDVLLAVESRDEGAPAPVEVRTVRGIASRTAADTDLEQLVDAVQPDVVHLHNVVNPTVLEAASDWPAVVTVQDHRAFCPARGKCTADTRACREPMSAELCAPCFEDRSYFEEIYALTSARQEALRGLPVIVLSEYMKNELQSVNIEQVQVIGPFIHDLPEGDAAEHEPCVLVAGRTVAAKGVYEAVEVWRRMETALPLVFAGTGSARPQLEDIPGVTVTGWLSHEALAGWYRSARVLLLAPRWQEPFGIVGLEALSAGLPVAAWDSGGISEWHPGPLPAWGDVDGLATRARQLLGATSMSPARPFERAALMAKLRATYERIAAC